MGPTIGLPNMLPNLRFPHSTKALRNTVVGVSLLIGGLYFPPWLRYNPFFQGHDMASHFFQSASPANIIYGEIIAVLALLLILLHVLSGESRLWRWGTFLIGVLGLTIIVLVVIFDVILATGRPFSRIPHNGWYVTFIGSIILLVTPVMSYDENN